MTSEICLSCIIRFPEHNKIKLDMAESEKVFKGVFEFSVQETSKDLLQNGKLIVLKLEQEAALETSPSTGCPCSLFFKSLYETTLLPCLFAWRFTDMF